jgi:hypothetical protein
MRNEKMALKVEAEPEAPAAAGLGAIEQVRELLFGETKRSTESRLDDIDRKIEMLRDDLAARFATLEARLVDQGRNTETKHNQSIDNIGQAIAELGATIKALGTGGKAR